MNGFPSQWARYAPLLERCGYAELTSAVLRKDDGSFQNVFSVLTFVRNVSTDRPVPALELLTKKLERVPGSTFQLAIARSHVTALDACACLPTGDHFVEPVNRISVKCEGAWTDPAFVGHEQHRLRALVPNVDAQFWAFQLISQENSLESVVGKKGLEWVLERISKELGAPLAARSDYAGGFIIVLPEYRGRMRVDRGENGILGVEFDGDRDAIRPAALARVSRNDEMCSAALLELNERFTILEVGASDFQEVELYDLASGMLIDRDAGTPLRSMGINLQSVEPISFDVTLFDQSQQPLGSPVQVRTNWGRTLVSGIDGRAEWERTQRRSAVLAEQKRLHAEGRLFFYSGGPGDRNRAIADIRGLIRMHSAAELCIWDPYFGGRDALEFLPHVVDPGTTIRVLTSLARTDDGTKYEGAKALLRQALSELVQPRGRGPGMTDVKIRIGNGFHDRFLITEVSCWQLGSSFNHIGNSYSTIVEFPYRDLVVKAFDKEWNDSQEFK